MVKGAEMVEQDCLTPKSIQERFWQKVDRRSEDECWEWKASKGWQGYGKFNIQGRTVTASRAAYMLATGNDPGELVVRHTCDNTSCCNPKHLMTGTIQDNRHDAVSRGRQAKGTMFPIAKLSDNDVRLVRSIHVKGSRTHGAKPLARRFNVSERTMRHVVNRTGWKHVV